jgi:hypothetical protein
MYPTNLSQNSLNIILMIVKICSSIITGLSSNDISAMEDALSLWLGGSMWNINCGLVLLIQEPNNQVKNTVFPYI